MAERSLALALPLHTALAIVVHAGGVRLRVPSPEWEGLTVAEGQTLRLVVPGQVDDRLLVEQVAQFMHDTSTEVRRAATESLLWDTEHRWNWIRYNVRRALADPLYANDGALSHEGQLLTAECLNQSSSRRPETVPRDVHFGVVADCGAHC